MVSAGGQHALVTGGAGFVGSHLVEALAARGWRVSVIDSFREYDRLPPAEAAAMRAARAARRPAGVELVRADLTDPRTLPPPDWFARFTHVVHLAGHPLAQEVERAPSLGASEIVAPTRGLLAALGDAPLRPHFTYVSSSMVYGDFPPHGAGEESVPAPVNEYGRRKWECENLVRETGGRRGWPVTIVRPSAVYGRHDANARVLFRLLRAAQRGELLRVFDAGEQLDFTHVTDLVAGLALCLEKEAARGETLNLTFGQARSVLEAARLAARLFGAGEVRVEGNAQGPKRGTLRTEKARRLIGYAPLVPLEAGMRAYAADLAEAP